MFELQIQFAQRRIQNVTQQKRWWPGGRTFSLPDHMQENVLEGGVLIMAMRAPSRITNINFDVARDGRGLAKSEHRIAKVRPALNAGKTRMKHAERLTVQGAQQIAVQALVLPDGLEQFLRRRMRSVTQSGGGSVLCPPAGVEVGGGRLHLELLLRCCFRKVKRRLQGQIERIKTPDGLLDRK